MYNRSALEYESHFWTPKEKMYLNFDWTFDQKKRAVAPSKILFSDRKIKKLTRSQRLVIESRLGHLVVSFLYYFEFFALMLNIKMKKLGETRRYEVKEEYRHLFTLRAYLKERWGKNLELTSLKKKLFSILEKVSTVQDCEDLLSIVEPINLSFLFVLNCNAQDPLLVRACSFIIADESVHLKSKKSAVKSEKLASMLLISLVSELEKEKLLMHFYDVLPDDSLIDEFIEQDNYIYNVIWSFMRNADINISPDLPIFDFKESSDKFLEELKLVVLGTMKYLKGFSLGNNDPMPDKYLTISWMMAGLKGSLYFNNLIENEGLVA